MPFFALSFVMNPSAGSSHSPAQDARDVAHVFDSNDAIDPSLHDFGAPETGELLGEAIEHDDPEPRIDGYERGGKAVEHSDEVVEALPAPGVIQAFDGHGILCALFPDLRPQAGTALTLSM